MSNQRKQDSNDLAILLKNLPEEDRLQVKGVIAGMQLAPKTATSNEKSIFPFPPFPSGG